MTPIPLGVGEPPNAFTLRKAAPSELPLLQALDSAACVMFDAIGLHVDLSPKHPFVTAEAERWERALHNGRGLVAIHATGELAAFAILGRLDTQPYLDQLSVHPAFMRRGLGAALLREVITQSASPLWLTTYAHVSWNAPYYARFGFRVISDVACGPELQRTLTAQRAALPHPEQRIAMARGL